MRKFGLIGFPLTHSFSKRFFAEKFESEGLSDCYFENFQIESVEEIEEILHRHPDLIGLSVTIPHKESIISLLDHVNETVLKIKACNCIKIFGGKLSGYNTDVLGFEKSFKEVIRPEYNKALILGTGGASKAVEYVLEKLGFKYKLVSRMPSLNNLSYEQLTPELIASTDVIINATPLGMYPDVLKAPDIPYAAINENHLLYDLIYNPPKTQFLKLGEEKGARIKNGFEMLEIQAEESWKIWNT